MKPYLKLESYDKVDDYKTKTLSTKTMKKTLKISRNELKRYALMLGTYGGHMVSAAGKSFYMSVIDFALKQTGDRNDCYYYMSEDYACAEPTFKTMISFFIGMAAAKAVAERKYKIPLLFHLSDKQGVTYQTKTGKSAPDFWGLRMDKALGIHVPYLFEAKGHSTNQYVDCATVKKAKDQLENISSVTVHGIGSTGTMSFRGKKIKKQIVTSSFEEANKQQYRKWIVCDIDPEESTGNNELKLDVNKETKAYYDQIFSAMKGCDQAHLSVSDRFKTEKIGKQSYILKEYNGEAFGIQKEIYEIIDAFDRNGATEGLYSEIQPILKKNKRVNTDTCSIGRDGVIYLDYK